VPADSREALALPIRLVKVVTRREEPVRTARRAWCLKKAPGVAVLCLVLAWSGFASAAATAPGALPPPSADKGELETILRHLQRHYQLTGSFSARFAEKITPVGGMERKREGTVYYRRPGRMRWEFAPPQAELIVSDGERIYTYQPDLNQVMETPLKAAFRSSSVTSFLLGMGNIERDFDASLPPPGKSEDSLVRVDLAPKGGGQKIELGLDPKTYDVANLKLIDALGNVTRISFADIKTNIALKDALFIFKVPRGADVVSAPSSP
jgi:outer membrane lipoprotein carrier protein